MAKIENAAKNAGISDDVIGRVAEVIARSDQLMKPNAVIVSDQVYHQLQVGLAEESLLHSRERLSTGKVAYIPRRHKPQSEKKGDTDSTADSSDTDKIRQDLPRRLTRKGKQGHHEDSGSDDEPFPFEQLEQSEDEINLQVKLIRPVSSLFTVALDYRTYRLVKRGQI